MDNPSSKRRKEEANGSATPKKGGRRSVAEKDCYAVVEIVPLLRASAALRFANGEPLAGPTPCRNHPQTNFKAFKKSQHIAAGVSLSPLRVASPSPVPARPESPQEEEDEQDQKLRSTSPIRKIKGKPRDVTPVREEEEKEEEEREQSPILFPSASVEVSGIFDWSIGSCIDWLIDWLMHWLIDWLIDALIDWLIGWLGNFLPTVKWIFFFRRIILAQNASPVHRRPRSRLWKRQRRMWSLSRTTERTNMMSWSILLHRRRRRRRQRKRLAGPNEWLRRPRVPWWSLLWTLVVSREMPRRSPRRRRNHRRGSDRESECFCGQWSDLESKCFCAVQWLFWRVWRRNIRKGKRKMF